MSEGLDLLANRLAALSSRRRSEINVWLSGALVRPFILDAVKGLKSKREALLVAERAASEALGSDKPQTLWLEDRSATTVGLAVAGDREAVNEIAKVHLRHGVRLAAIRPWWSKALDESLRLNPGLEFIFVEEPDCWTFLAGTRSFRFAEALAPPPEPGESSEWLRRMLFNAGTSAERGMRASLSNFADLGVHADLPPATLVELAA